jgi:hypothetical protein
MTEAGAEGILKDLARWRFGAILLERSGYQGLDAEALAQEVRAYRLAILWHGAPEFMQFDPAWLAATADISEGLLQAWKKNGSLQEAVERPQALAEAFLRRLESSGGIPEAMRRFAFGKLGKYGRRVQFLLCRLNES